MRYVLNLLIPTIVVGFVAGLIDDSWTAILGAQAMYLVIALFGDLICAWWRSARETWRPER